MQGQHSTHQLFDVVWCENHFVLCWKALCVYLYVFMYRSKQRLRNSPKCRNVFLLDSKQNFQNWFTNGFLFFLLLHFCVCIYYKPSVERLFLPRCFIGQKFCVIFFPFDHVFTLRAACLIRKTLQMFLLYLFNIWQYNMVLIHRCWLSSTS